MQERLDHMADHAITANYMALMLSIIKPRFSTERALARVALASVFQNPMDVRTDENGERITCKYYSKWSDEDIIEMARLRREGKDGKPMSLQEVGAVFGLTDKAIWAALKSRDMVEPGIIGGKTRGRKPGWKKKKKGVKA